MTRTALYVQLISMMNLDFVLFYYIPNNSLIQISIQQSMQMEFDINTPLQCYDNIAQSITSCFKSQDGNSIILDTICKTSCAAGQRLNIQIQKGIKNVNYVISPERLISLNRYIQIYSCLSDYSQVDGAKQIITPYLQVGVVKMQGLTRVQNLIFNFNTFIIQATSQSIIYNNNILALVMPNNLIQDDQTTPNQISCFQLSNSDKSVIQQLNCQSVVYPNNLYQEIQYIYIQGICGSLINCGNNFQITVQVQQIRNVGYFLTVNPTSQIYVKFQAMSLINTYEDVDSVNFNQIKYFNDLQNQGMNLYQIQVSNPLPGATSILTFKLSTVVGIYKGSSVQIKFANGFTLTPSNYICRLLSPYAAIGSCNSNGQILLISNLFSSYAASGNIIIQIDQFNNPTTIGSYSGFQVSIFTQDNNLITSTGLTSIALQIYINSQQNQCSGQCLTCGQNSTQCLSCYTPSKFPLFDATNNQCLSSCLSYQYQQSVPSLLQGVAGTFTCEKCDPSCQTCYGGSSNQCLKCNSTSSNNIFNEGQCINQNNCPFGSSVVNGVCQLANSAQCLNNCATCGPSKQFCYTCQSGFLLESNIGKCTSVGDGGVQKCSQTNFFYDKTTNQCQQCSNQCSSCSSLNICTQCSTLFGNYYQSNGQCFSQCPTGQFSMSNQVCQACIKNCNACSTSTTCYSCNSPSKLLSTTSECVSECPNGFKYISANNLCTNQQCTNPTCYQCTTSSSQCSACSLNNGYNVLLNNNCLTQTQACQQQQIYNLNLLQCQTCNVKQCKDCGLTSDQTYQQCQNCQSGYYLYLGNCYNRCPTGTEISINYYNDPNWVYRCIVVICKDSNCKSCNQLTLNCNSCKSGYALLETGCVTQCPTGYQLINTNSGQVCKNLYEGRVGIATVLIWILTFFLTLFILISFFTHKNKLLLPHSFLGMYSVSDFFIRFALLCSLYYNKEITVFFVGVCFIAVFVNSALGLLFYALYLSIYQQTMKNFINFKDSHPNFSKYSSIALILFGVFIPEIFQAQLYKMPNNTFHKNKPYKQSLIKLQKASLFISFCQIILYFYLIAFYIYSLNQEFFLSITGLVLTIIIFINFGLKIFIENKQANMNVQSDDNVNLIQSQQEQQSDNIKNEQEIKIDMNDREEQKL